MLRHVRLLNGIESAYGDVRVTERDGTPIGPQR